MVQPLSFPLLLSSKTTTNKNNTPTLFLGFYVDEEDHAADPADTTADPASTRKMITNTPPPPPTMTTLQELWYRWKALEVWSELAIRPKECHPDDRFLFQGNDDAADVDVDDDKQDDVPAIQHQGRVVQRLFNKQLSTLPMETTVWDPYLLVKPSQIPKAGHGLYYAPPIAPPSNDDDKKEEEGVVIPPNTLICYYTGHVHTYASAAAAATGSISEGEEDDDDELAQQQQQAEEAEGDERPMRTKEKPKKKKKERDRSYLMWIRDNIFVDPLRCAQIKARYINDPLNDECRNCHYVPTRIPHRPTTTTTHIPHPDTIRTGVVTTREIRPGEELFVSYGEAYWNDQHNQNANFVGTRFETQEEKKKNDTEKQVCGDTKYNNTNDTNNYTNDVDDDNDIVDDNELASLFPLSSKLFQTKLMAESIDWD